MSHHLSYIPNYIREPRISYPQLQQVESDRSFVSKFPIEKKDRSVSDGQITGHQPAVAQTDGSLTVFFNHLMQRVPEPLAVGLFAEKLGDLLIQMWRQIGLNRGVADAVRELSIPELWKQVAAMQRLVQADIESPSHDQLFAQHEGLFPLLRAKDFGDPDRVQGQESLAGANFPFCRLP